MSLATALLTTTMMLQLGTAAPALRVDLVFEGQTAATKLPKFEASVVDEVAAIWAPYGVDIQKADLHEPGREDAIRLSVVVADRPEPHMPASALGSILFLDDAPQPVIVMYPKAITDLVAETSLQGRRESEWPRLFRELVFGRVFGRALAHELGHYLLRERGHSIAGLMRAAQTGLDLVSPDRHPFMLTPTEASHFVSNRLTGTP